MSGISIAASAGLFLRSCALLCMSMLLVLPLPLPVRAQYVAAPAKAYAHAQRASECSRQGDHDCAIAELSQAMKHLPGEYSLHYNRGFAYFAKGRYEQALDDYSEAIRLKPDLAAGYNNRCLTRAVLNRELDRAKADCDHAARLVPDRVEPRDTLGFLYLRMGNFSEALLQYDAVLQVDPRHARALYGRGYAKARRGDPEGGAADMAAARGLEPDVAREYRRLGLE